MNTEITDQVEIQFGYMNPQLAFMLDKFEQFL